MQGRYIDLVDITDDLRVTVGGTRCNVTEIGYNIVICAPERPAVFTDNEPKKRVVVSAVNIRDTCSNVESVDSVRFT